MTSSIIINFGWKGPNTWRGGWTKGGLDAKVVDLLFKDAKTEISVHIPDHISPEKVQKLPFTCRRYHDKESNLNGRKFKLLDKETHPQLLKITAQQVRNLTIKAGIFEKSPRQGPPTMDSSGRITREEYVLRSDREIKLQVPSDLEIGKTYCLEITSKDFSFEARLVKE